MLQLSIIMIMIAVFSVRKAAHDWWCVTLRCEESKALPVRDCQPKLVQEQAFSMQDGKAPNNHQNDFQALISQ